MMNAAMSLFSEGRIKMSRVGVVIKKYIERGIKKIKGIHFRVMIIKLKSLSVEIVLMQAHIYSQLTVKMK